MISGGGGGETAKKKLLCLTTGDVTISLHGISSNGGVHHDA